MNTKLRSQPDEISSATDRVLKHLFSEYERARQERDDVEARLSRFAETIRCVIDILPPQSRQVYSHRFEELRRGVVAPSRGSEFFDNVVALFKNDPRIEWTIAEVHEALEKSSGTSPDSKALHNVLGYLARSGKLRRISRGRYLVTEIGAGVEMEDFEDGTTRTTEHDI